jgi:hypothetical protein
MNLKLTDDQRQAIEDHGGTPIYVINDMTNASYVLMRADQFERVKGVLEENDFDPREAYQFVEKVMRSDDANDPTLNSYQNLST